jgi:hypothetical protein
LALYWGARRRRGDDVTTRGFTPPESLKPTIEALERIGFTRLGEAQTKLPFQQLPNTEWVLVCQDQDTLAEVVLAGGGPYVQLQSAFPDDAALETGYPYGEKIETPEFSSGFEKTSLPEAVRVHQTRQEAFATAHGAPRKFTDMAGYLAWDALYRRKYARRKLRDPILRVHVIPFITEFTALLFVGFYSVLQGELPLWVPIVVVVAAVFIESGIWRGGRP